MYPIKPINQITGYRERLRINTCVYIVFIIINIKSNHSLNLLIQTIMNYALYIVISFTKATYLMTLVRFYVWSVYWTYQFKYQNLRPGRRFLGHKFLVPPAGGNVFLIKMSAPPCPRRKFWDLNMYSSIQSRTLCGRSGVSQGNGL